jgi:hypothetical protein
MAEQKQPTLTPEQIEQVKKEAADFEQKSIDLAASSPALSAHYWRLYTACRPSLKRFSRMELTARNKAAAEKRKTAKKNAKAGKPAEPAGRTSRPA